MCITGLFDIDILEVSQTIPTPPFLSIRTTTKGTQKYISVQTTTELQKTDPAGDYVTRLQKTLPFIATMLHRLCHIELSSHHHHCKGHGSSSPVRLSTWSLQTWRLRPWRSPHFSSWPLFRHFRPRRDLELLLLTFRLLFLLAFCLLFLLLLLKSIAQPFRHFSLRDWSSPSRLWSKKATMQRISHHWVEVIWLSTSLPAIPYSL